MMSKYAETYEKSSKLEGKYLDLSALTVNVKNDNVKRTTQNRKETRFMSLLSTIDAQ
jgi:hypothetical protein